jgi:hypothetical protein
MKHGCTAVPGESVPVDSDDLRVVETIHGTWVYHLARGGAFRGLCGALVMNTAILLDGWGRSSCNTSLRERWCAECAKLGGIKTGSESRE